ncbi:hypothetical protein [Priestia megaterium]|uniref:hypothetical protein n=1 Tax=Priestia megaterium TaxID=1404 RepID=UPI001C24164D|nr:hypothetical protein [Priestia megaterium]MBU8757650.1 hypothetical protein [Priestia megaterium]
MDTGMIIGIAGVVATLLAGFAAWKFYINKKINKNNQTTNKIINNSDGKYQISNMDSNNNTVNFGVSNESDKQD